MQLVYVCTCTSESNLHEKVGRMPAQRRTVARRAQISTGTGLRHTDTAKFRFIWDGCRACTMRRRICNPTGSKRWYWIL